MLNPGDFAGPYPPASPQCADISVVIPSFERTELAMETIHSVLQQWQPVREIVVVVNGSDEHARFWEAQASGRLRVIRDGGRGQQAARNTGLRAARSQWVAFLDDDDIYHPGFVASVLPAIEDGRADVIGTDHRKFHLDRVEERTNFEAAPAGYWDGIRPNDPAKRWSFVGEFPLDRLLKRVPIYPSTMVIRREFALSIGGFNPEMFGIPSEDIEFLVRAATHGQMAIVWQPLVYYRVHGGNFSKSGAAKQLGRWRIFEFVRNRHDDLPDSFRKALDADLPRRRRRAFRIAWRAGWGGAMDEAWSRLGKGHRTPDVLALRLLSGRWRASPPPGHVGLPAG